MAKLSHQSNNSVRPACNKCGYRMNLFIHHLIKLLSLYLLLLYSNLKVLLFLSISLSKIKSIFKDQNFVLFLNRLIQLIVK